MNTQLTLEETLKQAIDGVQKLVGEPVEAPIVSNADGTFSATFTLLEPGNYCAPVYSRDRNTLSVQRVEPIGNFTEDDS